MNIDLQKAGLKIVTALLFRYGEISIESIRALPFLTRPGDSDLIIKTLLELFDVEIYRRKIDSYPIPEWEPVIRLKHI
jgi:hypothetical protein